MPRLLILTLGFEERFAFRMLTRYGLDRGDHILLLTGKLVEKTMKAITMIEEFIKKYFLGEIKITYHEIDLSNFSNAVSSIREILSRYIPKYNKIILNLSGGMRVLILATYTSILLLHELLRDKDVVLEVEFEDGSQLVKIPSQLPQTLMNLPKLTSERFEVLKALGTVKEATIRELAKITNKDETTIRRHIQHLQELNLVSIVKERPQKYALTQLGLMLISS